MAIPASVAKIGLRYGALAFVLMVVYFLICIVLGWQTRQAVRFGSHAFTVVGVFLAIRAFKAQTTGPAPYLSGLGVGFLVGLVGSVLYGGFILLYASVLNTPYHRDLENQAYFGTYVGPVMLVMAIALLGTIIGSLTGYILMMSDGTDYRSRTGMNGND